MGLFQLRLAAAEQLQKLDGLRLQVDLLAAPEQLPALGIEAELAEVQWQGHPVDLGTFLEVARAVLMVRTLAS